MSTSSSLPVDAGQTENTNWRIRPWHIGAAAGLACGILAPPLLLGAVGFGAAGPIAGGLAASMQTATTAAGSWFAIMQSAGMAGVACSTTAACGLGGSAAGAAISSQLTPSATPRPTVHQPLPYPVPVGASAETVALRSKL